MRLNKFLAQAGIASRRRADQLIGNGEVRINGTVVRELGIQVNPDHDQVTYRGRQVRLVEEYCYIALHKPVGYVSTRARFAGERSVMELLPPDWQRLVIAGRLDKASSGLLLLTDDGSLVNELTHPSFGHEKEYLVTVDAPVRREDVQRLRQGVRLEEGVGRFDRIVPAGRNAYRVVLHQGWKRQIRRMFTALGYRIESLQRVRIGKLQLGTLPAGQYRPINRRDIVGPSRRDS